MGNNFPKAFWPLKIFFFLFKLFSGLGHDKSVDWWSLGAILYEIISGAPPFYSKDKHEMCKNRIEVITFFILFIKLKKDVPMKPVFSEDLRSLLKGLLQKNVT